MSFQAYTETRWSSFPLSWRPWWDTRPSHGPYTTGEGWTGEEGGIQGLHTDHTQEVGWTGEEGCDWGPRNYLYFVRTILRGGGG